MVSYAFILIPIRALYLFEKHALSRNTGIALDTQKSLYRTPINTWVNLNLKSKLIYPNPSWIRLVPVAPNSYWPMIKEFSPDSALPKNQSLTLDGSWLFSTHDALHSPEDTLALGGSLEWIGDSAPFAPRMAQVNAHVQSRSTIVTETPFWSVSNWSKKKAFHH